MNIGDPWDMSERVLTASDVSMLMHARETEMILTGACGGLIVLVFVLVMQTAQRWRSHVLWKRSQPKPDKAPFRD